ncbi:peptide chain release factor 3 [Acetobacteraceae bacterium]|nr:peptide chain release factor 3 [Acetobacteraceae bacterium]
MSPIEKEVRRRRTFAIISHPDAGKTTLTERILHAAGAIQMAGHVRAKGERRRTRSDWLAIEQQRGISVATSAMTFSWHDYVFNLLDTPGHEDFSEDTYRTLTAVDCAIMVIDAAKGIEERTRKLFEICRLRDIPILTLINKMDRESEDCFDLLEEISSALALDVCPVTWPVGRGATFCGIYDISTKQWRLSKEIPEDDKRRQVALEEAEVAADILPSFDSKAFLEGSLSPVFFGSAIKDIGIEDLLMGLAEKAPFPKAQHAIEREVNAEEDKLTALVFRIQANMDPNHRDRMAFARICSGRLERGMKLTHVRLGKQFGLNAPQFFFAKDRQIAEEGYAGDVVGIPNRGNLRIGDTLTEGEVLHFTGVPSFAPEILRRIRIVDAMKAKKLRQGLKELGEEGVSQIFRPMDGSQALVGVVGTLQLDVMQARLAAEYKIEVTFEGTSFSEVRWVRGERTKLEDFFAMQRSSIAEDIDGDPVFLSSSAFMMERTIAANPDLEFLSIKRLQGAS